MYASTDGFYSFGNNKGYYQQFAVRNHIRDKAIIFKNAFSVLTKLDYVEAQHSNRGTQLLESYDDNGYICIDFTIAVPDFSKMFTQEITAPEENTIDTQLINKLRVPPTYVYYPGQILRFKIRISLALLNKHNGVIESKLLKFIIEDELVSKNEPYHQSLNEFQVKSTKTNEVEYTGNHQSIRIIDPDRQIGDQWILVNGSPKHIKVERNTELPTGIYIYENYGEIKNIVYGINELTKEKLMSLGLYTSKKDAEVGKNSQYYINKSKEQQKLTEEVEKLKEANKTLQNKLESKELKHTQALDMQKMEVASKELKHTEALHQLQNKLEIQDLKHRHTLNKQEMEIASKELKHTEIMGQLQRKLEDYERGHKEREMLLKEQSTKRSFFKETTEGLLKVSSLFKAFAFR